MKRDRRQTAADNRRCNGTWTGKDAVCDFLLDAFPDEAESRIAYRRSSCISDKAQFLAVPKTSDQLRKASLLIMLMETNERLADLQISEKLSSAPRVLSNHGIATAQRLDSP
jgi:hypothetical protein